MTPTQLASELWPGQSGSGSLGAKRVRALARRRFRGDAPGLGGRWDLTDAQVAELRAELGKMPAPRSG